MKYLVHWITLGVLACHIGASAEPLVSPIVNRELETSVIAHTWPSTPASLVCEAFTYHFAMEQAYTFLERLFDMDADVSTYARATAAVLEATPLVSTSKSLLQLSLSMRAQSPHCELHRQLAREAWQSLGASVPPRVMAVANGKVLDAPSVAGMDWSTLTDTDDDYSVLLPGEKPAGDKGPLVVLYADLSGLRTAAAAYRHLRSQAIRLVVRCMGVVDYEENPSAASPTVLQGYGVRLDIRNVEYKVFDDRFGDSSDDAEVAAMVDPTKVPAPPQFLAGVNLTALGIEQNANVWQQHERQQSQAMIVPPVWQRRQLPLQATTVIHSSSDPLATLEELSQNLPSVASTLVHVKIDEAIAKAAEELEHQRLRSGRLFVNGRAVSFERPSFNVFELLNLLREEQASLDKLQAKLSPLLEPKQLVAVQKAWAMGEDFFSDGTANAEDNLMDDDDDEIDEGDSLGGSNVYRIDVARGGKGAVLYVNDIEKDPQYAQWPTSVRQMLMGLNYGMPPAVRRNLFTFLAVTDPIKDASKSLAVQLALQLMQNNFPARLGLLIVAEDDVDRCTAWLAENSVEEGDPCPILPILQGTPSLTDLKRIDGSSQAIHRLITWVATKFEKQPGAILAYTEYLMQMLARHQETQGDVSMFDLTMLHGNLMEGMRIASTSEAQNEALQALLSDGDDRDYTYGKAIRFAAEKRIKPEMGFLNGRPLAATDDGTRKAFQEEQRAVFEMIAKGEITDATPRTVYTKILTGDRVFKKFHPLLAGDASDMNAYVELNHQFGAESLLNASSSSSPAALFVVDVALDFGTSEGVELAVRLINDLSSFPSTITGAKGQTDIAVSFRVVPSSQGAVKSALCPIFAYASLLGQEQLLSMLAAVKDEPVSYEAMVESLPTLPESAIEVLLAPEAPNTCSRLHFPASPDSSNYMVANGRKYIIEKDTSVTVDDIELLLTMELGRSKAISKLLRENGSATLPDSVSKIAAFLGREIAVAQATGEAVRKSSIVDKMHSSANPLLLSWPGDDLQHDGSLKVEVSAIVDPVSESAQRLAPLLLVLRDELKAPISVLMAPALLVDGDSQVPITSYFRFVASTAADPDGSIPKARFTSLPTNHILTLRMDVPEPWNVQQTFAIQDTDNLRCDVRSGCCDEAHSDGVDLAEQSSYERRHLTRVEYGLKSLLVFGQCYETQGKPPNGLQLTLSKRKSIVPGIQNLEVGMDGSIISTERALEEENLPPYSDTLVMLTVGYWQLHAGPGVWDLRIAEESKGAEIFDIVDGVYRNGRLIVNKDKQGDTARKTIVMQDFVNKGGLLLVKRRQGFEKASLFHDEKQLSNSDDDDVINVFSLATGHLYERFLKIMMLSVTKRTSKKVKFWLFENFLSPTFKESAKAMAKRIGSEVEFVTYKWPEWLRAQSEKQRIIWGYKILFLDVLFPLGVKKIIYVDADQVVRGDLKELWDMDLQGAPYGYTPFCSSRETTIGYQFWRQGFWKTHLRDKTYHISALYVVDLELFRRTQVGDGLRSIYQQLSADKNSLANLDQDLPNYAQTQIPIFSLPQEWLWCESWCSDETKAVAKTIDLCNNPLHKEPKVSMAKRIISGPLFNESWEELDAEVERYEKEYRESLVR